MKKIIVLLLVLIVLLLLGSCAAGPSAMKNTEFREGKTAGFGYGLWHGIITPVTFVVSLFRKTVGIYEPRNNGGWYNFGYVLGLAIIFGGGAGGGASRRRRR